jgi:hypothetical protein
MTRNRFSNFSISEVTLDNCNDTLPESIRLQVEMFLPPSGSFDTKSLRRYLENLKEYEDEDPHTSMTLANRLRLAFIEDGTRHYLW